MVYRHPKSAKCETAMVFRESSIDINFEYFVMNMFCVIDVSPLLANLVEISTDSDSLD